VLVVRDLLRGYRKFDELTAELGISRKVLAERLKKLEAHGLLSKVPYQEAPVRHEYRLTPRGEALIPVLIALQDWGDRWLLGDGEPTALSGPAAHERIHALKGTSVPRVSLPATTGGSLDVVSDSRTVLFGYPMTVMGSAPEGWQDIPGAPGCTLENRLFRDAYPQFQDRGLAVRGVSTQRPAQQFAFAEQERVPYPLLSDAQLQLTAALRLPTFTGGETPRLRRFVLLIEPDRTILDVLFPVTDLAGAVKWALAGGAAKRSR
jgi:DNA-binding HxlR family transcriptional regulator/peroxiredoxin